MLRPPVIPNAVPAHKVPGYQMPESRESLLTWDFVIDQMTHARYYWLSSTSADGRPHTVPVWGIWYADRVQFDGSYQTAWSRNLTRDPRITVHLPDAEKVVIIEGLAHTIADDAIDKDTWKIIDSAFQTKYAVPQGSPYWVVYPLKVLAWNGANLRTMTRWLFERPMPPAQK